MKRDTGLDTLLAFDGYTFVYPSKHWYKIDVRLVKPSPERPHGIRYSMTLHDQYGTRIFGMDNKHVPKNRRKGFHGRIIEYDHVHTDNEDRGTPYSFISAEKLLADFFASVDRIIED